MTTSSRLFIWLYLDEDVQRGVAVALRGRGFDTVSAHEVGRKGLSDAEQLAYAAAGERALVTFNVDDFLCLHREALESGRPHWGVILSEQAPIGEVTRRLLNLLNRVTADEIRDQVYWLQSFR